MIENLRIIWFNIIDGRRREYIRKEWRDRFYDFSLEEFGRPMRFKVGALLRERDSILKEAAPYRRQLRRCEYAVASALKGLPVEEKFNGDSMLKVFTSKKVLEYAEHLHEEEEYRTLRDVYGLLVDKSSFLGIEFRYSNFKSFKRAYYRYRQ